MNPGFLELLKAAPEDRRDVFLGAAPANRYARAECLEGLLGLLDVHKPVSIPADRILVAPPRNQGARLLTRGRALLDCGRKRHARIVCA